MIATLIAALMWVLAMIKLLLASPPSQLIWTGIDISAASGIMSSTLGRLCNYMSIERLGLPISASIIGSSQAFSMLFAVLIIDEKITPNPDWNSLCDR